MGKILKIPGKAYRLFERNYNKIKNGVNDYLYPVDVMFFSFPKSGRTWVRLFISYYYSKFTNKNLELNLESKSIFGELPRIRFEHGLYIGNQYNQNSFEIIDDKLAKNLKNYKVIYMKRDPRDVFVSFFYNVTKREIPNDDSVDFKNISIDELILNDKYGFMNIWNYNKYWDSVFSNHKNCLTLFYEDLLKNPEVGFFNLVKFLELDIKKEFITEAISETSIDKLKKKYNNSSEHRLKQLDSRDSNSAKFRSGKSGSYLSELSKDSINFCNKIMEI